VSGNRSRLAIYEYTSEFNGIGKLNSLVLY